MTLTAKLPVQKSRHFLDRSTCVCVSTLCAHTDLFQSSSYHAAAIWAQISPAVPTAWDPALLVQENTRNSNFTPEGTTGTTCVEDMRCAVRVTVTVPYDSPDDSGVLVTFLSGLGEGAVTSAEKLEITAGPLVPPTADTGKLEIMACSVQLTTTMPEDFLETRHEPHRHAALCELPLSTPGLLVCWFVGLFVCVCVCLFV